MAADMTGGLAISREEVLVEAPEDPAFREGVNIWLQDDLGRFSLPRIGLEAISGSWGHRAVQANMAFSDGRVLIGSCEGPAIGPYDEQGRAARIGAGPIEFRCIEPFHRWTMSFRGQAVDTTIADQVAATVDGSARVDVSIDVDMTMAVPPWIQGEMSAEARKLLENGEEGLFMGGDRYEQLFRASGRFVVDGEALDFSATGLRIHRQGVRDTGEFWGHCWQTAVFPSGKAFGYIAFPDRPSGEPSYKEGYVFDGEQMLPAVVVKAPWMKKFEPHGGDVSLVLESELGVAEILGVTQTATAIPGVSELAKVAAMANQGNPRRDLFFHQGSAMYTWDGETSHGMIERSLPNGQVAR